MRFPALLLASGVLLLGPISTWAAPSPEEVEFFEKRIRPILAQECYECHSSTGKHKGGLVLDSRPGWQKGGDSGETIIPGAADKSLLLRTIRHLEPDLKMPKNGAPLEERVVQDFARWVDMGAPDPRDFPSPKADVDHDRDWTAVLERRKGWWSLQPLRHPAPPEVPGSTWSPQPIDRFLQAAMAKQGLQPASEAEPRTILRRMSYVLTGLAPTPAETEQFMTAAQANLESAIDAAADQLLASPRFGEQWARHWMDWVRYAESHGSEGDPGIPYAWRYRDYLIRALNADVPYPQLVREQIAGDLLEHPRLNTELGLNESAIGAAQFRFVLHGFAPTDTLDELVTFTDNQIDTISKAFLGLTVSCARCHNHKFDAISQTDFYALYGIMASCRPALIDVNSPERQRLHCDELKAVKTQMRTKLADGWLTRLDAVMGKLKAWQPPTDDKQLQPLLLGEQGPLAAWIRLRDRPPEEWGAEWKRLKDSAGAQAKRLVEFRTLPTLLSSAKDNHLQPWLADGAGLTEGHTEAGAFHLCHEGPRVIADIYPGGRYTHLLSDKQRGVFSSPRFTANGGKVWVHLRGDGRARARASVQNYPRNGLLHLADELTGGLDHWLSWDLDYWRGDQLYAEFSTEADQPVETANVERSWFGVQEVIIAPGDAPPPPLPGAPLASLCRADAAPGNLDELAMLYREVLERLLQQWRDGGLTDNGAEFLGQFVRLDLLPNAIDELPEVAALVAEYRRLEAEVPIPTRVPGVLEGFAFDQPLFTRGDHKKPSEVVPRRFLEALDATPYQAGEHQSGRRALAESFASPSNPLSSRVIVNRLWQYVFGQGLVGTPDNLGRLGDLPTHPELLEYLASEFRDGGGSLKKALRQLVTTRAFRLTSRLLPETRERDPENHLLTHFTARRLEAESIRDSMLALTGHLELATAGGPSVAGAEPRRAVYTQVIRNNLDPLLTAFDFPVPFSTRGRRDATNVPAQALALLNDPTVAVWAEQWAQRLISNPTLPDAERLRGMFTEAFGRLPSSEELAQTLPFVAAAADATAADRLAKWAGLAQAIFNAKEFIYLP